MSSVEDKTSGFRLEDLLANAAPEKPKNEIAKSKGISWGFGAIIFLLSISVSSILGAAGGYYAALSIPVPNQVMVFDIGAVTKLAVRMASNGVQGGDVKKVGEMLLDKSQKRLDEYKERGIIILDKESVIDAPRELIINIEDDLQVPLTSSPASQEEMAKKLKELERQLDEARLKK